MGIRSRGAPGEPRRLAHARPVTASARRRAGELGLVDEAASASPASGSLASLPRPIGSLRRPRSGRRRWLVASVLLVVVGILAVAAAQPLDLRLAKTEAGGPRSSASPVASDAGWDVQPLIAPSPSLGLAPVPTPLGLPSGYRWPLDHARITAWFGPRSDGIFLADGQKVHDGIDIASFCGDRIEAAHDGVVLAAGRRVDDWLGWVGSLEPYHARLDAKHQWGGRAIMVIVDDGDGYRSVYIHLARAVVTAGQQVQAGQLLGYEGATGDATGCHLHYSLFSPTDPVVFQTDPALVKRLSLPFGEIARIDPLLVLPPMATVDVTWGWGAKD